jgi:hypothetical protein
MTSVTESSEGGGIVMTSYTVAAPQKAWALVSDSAVSGPDARRARGVARQTAVAVQHDAAAAAQEFPSYAAVPVRGGWLVVQM